MLQQNLNQDILLDKLGLPTEGPQTDKRDRVSRYDTGVEGEEVEMEGEVDVMIDISGQVMLSTMKYMAGLTGLTVSERYNKMVSSHQYYDSLTWCFQATLDIKPWWRTYTAMHRSGIFISQLNIY